MRRYLNGPSHVAMRAYWFGNDMPRYWRAWNFHEDFYGFRKTGTAR